MVSDHAAICYDSSPNQNLVRRPYQVENRCLQFEKIQAIIVNSWEVDGGGSSMFKVKKNLLNIRSKLQNWCLSNRKCWGVNWKETTSSLTQKAGNRVDVAQGNAYIEKINEWLPLCSVKFQYWQQRMMEKWIKEIVALL